MNIAPYISDILDQPAALCAALDNYPAAQIGQLKTRLERGDFSRIVLTGMGSSFNSAYPAWLNLLALDTPAIHVNGAELLHYGRRLVDSRTLLWVNSQSGASVEIVRLLEQLRDHPPAFQLSMTNNLESPMARSASLAVPIHAGPEATVSSKTFINTLAMLMLASTQLIGGDWQNMLASMRRAADGIAAYQANWEERVADLDEKLGRLDQVLILGRGASMAAVWNGALINKEASKVSFEGMLMAEFRHGPLELASDRLTILVLEGAPQTARLNRDLAALVQTYGGKVFWLATSLDPELTTLLLPAVDETVRPLVEILPFQTLSLVMARRAGIEPGKFRHIGKVTEKE